MLMLYDLTIIYVDYWGLWEINVLFFLRLLIISIRYSFVLHFSKYSSIIQNNKRLNLFKKKKIYFFKSLLIALYHDSSIN